MQNSSLINLILSFEAAEIKKCRLFLESPYFNKNINVIHLFDHIISNINKAEKPDNKHLHSVIFPGEKFSNENIKTIIYLLSKLIEQFFVINDLENDKPEVNRRLLSVLDKKGLDKHFIKYFKKNEKQYSADNLIEVDTLYDLADYERVLIEFHTKRNNEKEMFTREQKFSSYLITAFFVDIFKQYNIFWRTGYLGNVKGIEFTTDLLSVLDLDKLFKIFKEKDFPYKEVLVPYYEIYNLLKETNTEIDIKILIGSINNNPIITGNEKLVLSTLLVNTLYYMNLKSGNLYNRHLFEAFKLLLKLYKHSGELHLRYTIFSNVLRIGLQLGEFDWTESFIKNSHVLLEPSIKENMFNYSNAYLSFAKNDFDKCLEYESKINFDTFQQRYYLRDLRLCSLYELGKFETALSLIDSYKHFIKKDTSYTAKMKQGHMLFLGYINDLIRLKLGLSRKNINDVNIKLQSSLPMRKDWLMKKFAEL